MPSLNSIGKFFVMVVLVMIGIYAVKMATKKFNIPVLSTVAEEV